MWLKHRQKEAVVGLKLSAANVNPQLRQGESSESSKIVKCVSESEDHSRNILHNFGCAAQLFFNCLDPIATASTESKLPFLSQLETSARKLTNPLPANNNGQL